jgi:hypothetical protein
MITYCNSMVVYAYLRQGIAIEYGSQIPKIRLCIGRRLRESADNCRQHILPHKPFLSSDDLVQIAKQVTKLLKVIYLQLKSQF